MESLKKVVRDIGGFFGMFDYNKPGKGVEKYEPKKNPFALFFILLYRKFFKIVQLNFLYLMFTIPFLLIMIFVFSPFILKTVVTPENYSLYIFYFSMFLVYIGIAPVNTGLAYILRSYAREEHAWVFQDFWDQIKKNFKISIKIFLIDVVVMVIVFVNFTIFSFLSIDSILYLVSKVILVSGCVLYIIMHFYLYQIIITFDIKLIPAFKNALLFTLAKLPMNLLIMVMIFIAGWIMILYPILFLVIGVTPFAFATNFYAERVISKYLITPMQGNINDDELEE